MASHRLKAAAVSIVRQQVAPWLPQEKKNRKREELGDWLTFPVRAEVVDPEVAVLMVSDACDEHDEPPGGCPHFHPMGRGHRAERRCLVGSPGRYSTRKTVQTFNATEQTETEGATKAWAHLSVTSDFDWLVFVPGVGQVSRFSERKLPPGRKTRNFEMTSFYNEQIHKGLQLIWWWNLVCNGSEEFPDSAKWTKQPPYGRDTMTWVYLQSQSILKTPPSILAFIPAGRTQWIGEPPWWDSDAKRAKPTGQTSNSVVKLKYWWRRKREKTDIDVKNDRGGFNHKKFRWSDLGIFHSPGPRRQGRHSELTGKLHSASSHSLAELTKHPECHRKET